MTDDVVVTAIVNLFTAQKPHRKPIASLAALAASAPPSAKRLLDAIATHKVPSWEIGRRFFIAGIKGTLAAGFARRGVEAPFDTAKSCEIGGSYGEPHIAWGFRWTDDGSLVFVEIEDKTVHSYSPAAWFANLRPDELAVWAKHDRPPCKELVAFCEACGDPVPPELLAKPKPSKPKKPAKASKAR